MQFEGLVIERFPVVISGEPSAVLKIRHLLASFCKIRSVSVKEAYGFIISKIYVFL